MTKPTSIIMTTKIKSKSIKLPIQARGTRYRLGTICRDIRTKRGETINETAEELSVSKKFVQSIESGKSSVSFINGMTYLIEMLAKDREYAYDFANEFIRLVDVYREEMLVQEPKEKLINQADAAKILGVTPTTIAKHIRIGKLTPIIRDGKKLFRKGYIESKLTKAKKSTLKQVNL